MAALTLGRFPGEEAGRHHVGLRIRNRRCLCGSANREQKTQKVARPDVTAYTRQAAKADGWPTGISKNGSST